MVESLGLMGQHRKMSAGSLSTLFSWLALAFTLATLISSGLALHYRHASSKEKDSEISRLNVELSDAGSKVAELVRLQTPRKLDDNQKTKLVDSLANAPKGKLTIKASVNAPDARDYAGQIAAIFAAAGWSAPIDNALFMGGDTSGIWITVRSAKIPPVANVVYDALKQAEIPVRDGAFGDASGPAEDEVWLNIGSTK
ncbi:hypothetical protein GWE18_26445 [Bradyrhizobium sp. CSA112]|uniref:hypothetical protein n=1 Tax=Bradyrhizobium sp. CSA112 TaxID=2699170 RepID=UPI0023B0962B|nr:hypothetical protein [Bradyrhizobium sp. CSA112]MDE5456303.1 hypothetical protein [Bradyrhizobium sp. CSA112]